MDGATVEWIVKFGDLLIVASLIFYVGRFSRKVDDMQKQVDRIEKTHESIASALTTLAVQKVQIERIERDVHDLRRGVGWIGDHGAKSVEREY